MTTHTHIQIHSNNNTQSISAQVPVYGRQAHTHTHLKKRRYHRMNTDRDQAEQQTFWYNKYRLAQLDAAEDALRYHW